MSRLSAAIVALPLSALAAMAALAHGGAVHAAGKAQWVKVDSASGSDSYLDKASIGQSGDGYRAATLVSFRTAQSTPDGTSYSSMLAHHLYSCERRTSTLLSQTYYPEAMGKGPVGQSFKYEKFAPEDIVPGSAAESALRIVCARRR